MTDTPESDKAKIAFTLMFANDDAYLIPYTVGMKLERERDEARDQRDSLAEALRMITTFDYTDLQCDNGHGPRSVATEALQSLNQTNELWNQNNNESPSRKRVGGSLHRAEDGNLMNVLNDLGQTTSTTSTRCTKP